MNLFEKSDILFRFMTFEGFLDMLEHDQLRLAVDLETKKQNQYVLGGFFSSFARSLSSSYLKRFEKNVVIIVVNGERLGQRYQLVPFDYRIELYQNDEDDEMEERLILDRNVIPNFTKYLIEAHLLISQNKICDYANIIERILQLAKEKGVRVKVHIDVKNTSWTYLRNHDETDTIVKLLKTCKKQKPLPNDFFVSYDETEIKNRLEAFFDLVQFAEKGGELSKLAFALLYRNEHVANDKDAVKTFLLDWIITPLLNNSRPGSFAYSEAVKVAKLFQNKDPVEFVQKIFKKAREREYGISQ